MTGKFAVVIVRNLIRFLAHSKKMGRIENRFAEKSNFRRGGKEEKVFIMRYKN